MISQELIDQARTPVTSWWPLTVNPIVESPQGWQQEEWAWNHTVALWECKMKGLPYIRISGPDATRLMAETCINKFSPTRDGIVKEVLSCRDDGKIVYDTVCLVTAPGVYELSGSPARFNYMCEKYGPYDVKIEDIGPRTFIQVSGPKAFDLLSELTDYDLTTIKFGHFAYPVTFGGFDDVRLARFNMTNELGFEIQTDPDHYDSLVQQIKEVGQKYGLVQIGARSHLVQHAEGGQLSITYGDAVAALCDDDPYAQYLRDIQDYTFMGDFPPKICGSFEPEEWSDLYVSPVDIGLARRIDFSKDFVGKEALAEEAANPKRKFVCLEWNKEDVIDVYASMFADGEPHERLDTPHYDYMELPRDPRCPIEASKVLVDGELIAHTTSRSYFYSFRKMVSNCLIPIEYSEPGTEVTIVWGEPGHLQKEIRGTVQSHPYKPIANRTLPTD